MNRQLPTDDEARPMLRSVSQAIALLRETDFAPGFTSEENASLLQLLGIRAGTVGAGRVAGMKQVSRWRDIVSQTGLEPLKNLFSQSRVIPFSDWTGVHQAADLWYGLLADVIRPMARKDWEFIFYLGNPANRLFFDVDEILDVMGSFTRSGNVTLALDEREAWEVWSMLFRGKDVQEFGMHDPDAKGCYRALFQSLDIRRLIIYSETHAALVMQNSYFEIARPAVPASMHNERERDNFIEGYSLGLKNGMEPAHSLILGIATAGSVSDAGLSRSAVLTFLSEWLDGI
ncbi:hypothetical protein [Dyadobacter aurulentus]|uniref:hypothetical protein n=1 Tax=Dyadobacter sp. UC 10 TaxID=2605428 RepID=UPI0011F360D3|nr:hypothetical protein [Dyadobacter sp. UC 10]KAA0989225.1 hypothetical protein FXO21_03140 [Dyadobacter sp. UC 10]